MSSSLNRLADETSPYLQQHASNPVDWYPWSEEALKMAQQENKPILLSIGYSACHWCHVMAHESFENPATAEIMNHHFINIKIDREERPDLDKIYQTAQLMLTQRSGGWPLTMFLTPNDQIPFFGGTYFPDSPRHGLPGFGDLLINVSEYYHQHTAEIHTQNASMLNALGSLYRSESESTDLPRPDLFKVARNQLEQNFDERQGGFGSAPKFPHPTNIDRLLRHWASCQMEGMHERRALHMALFSLQKMAQGGLYDHLGGGFCRYSTDDQWMIPHFEKMLYDNGPLLALCSEAYAISGEKLFETAARQTADWIMRDMQSPEGGYYSSLDADSEGKEGEFYVWESATIKQLLTDDGYAVFARHYGLDRPANFEDRWHLHVFIDIRKLANEFNQDIESITSSLETSRKILLTAREERIHPGRDEKILTSWNGLMIRGMAIAARHLRADEYADSATRALDFIRSNLWNGNRLVATYKDGKAHLNAYLDDYAFLIDGILELLQIRWNSAEFDFACALADVLLEQFEDNENGGFYFTSNDHEQLIQRPKVLADEATPSGNGIAAIVLARLGYLTGETRYLRAVERSLKYAANSIEKSPIAYASLLTALEEQLSSPQTIILRGQSKSLAQWQQACIDGYAPKRLYIAIPNDSQNLPQSLQDKKPIGNAVAYICRGLTCSAPVMDFSVFQVMLNETKATL